MMGTRRAFLLTALVLGLGAFDAHAQGTQPVTAVTQVVTGASHTCALFAGSGVKCWGQNAYGQLGDGTGAPRTSPVDVTGLPSNVVSLAAGSYHTCALLVNGGVRCWGRNGNGQLGDGTFAQQLTPVTVTGLGGGAARVSAGAYHTCAVMASGGVRCWGFNLYGQIGDGTSADRAVPTSVSGLGSGVVETAAGGFHTCARTLDGAAKCWGANTVGGLGDGTNLNRSTPVDVSGLGAGVTAISAGADHTCALSSGGVAKCWGGNDTGRLGDGTFVDRSTPVTVVGLSSDFTSVSAGAQHTCALTAAGGVRCWGGNGNGQLGDGTLVDRTSSVDVSGLGSGLAGVSAGGSHTCAPTVKGSLKCWGANTSGQVGDGSNTDRMTPTQPRGLSVGAVQVSAGGYHTCALTEGGGALCWGFNYYGQLGDGTWFDQDTPVSVAGLTEALTSIEAGGLHTCAVTASGGARCWGDNYYGQLGDGTTQERLLPMNVSGLASGVARIAAGSYHTCALTSGGGVKCWGYNSYGQVGDGTFAFRNTPVDVAGLGSGVVALTAGSYHTCAVLNTGAVKCWGSNREGGLGIGNFTSHSTPVAVIGLTTAAAQTSAGFEDTCALDTGGGVRCWGYNLHGQLGDGTTIRRAQPVSVSGLSSGVTQIDAGQLFTCALTTSGGLKCWGDNRIGALGDGTTIQRSTPVDVVGLQSGVARLSAGLFHTCAVLSSGALKCWGNNYDGQVGDGTTQSQTTPVVIFKASQSLTFTPPSGVGLGLATSLAGSASSGQPVTFDTWTPSICSVTGATVTPTAFGLCGIRVSQVGNDEYLPAPQRLFLVPVAGPPSVSTLPASGVTESTATLNGTAKPNGLETTRHFEFGTTRAYGSATAATNIGSGFAFLPFALSLEGLACNTLFHFRAVATNALGTVNGVDSAFTTSACPPPPTVTTEPAGSVTQTGATLKATINPNGGATRRRFEWGPTNAYGGVTPDVSIGAGFVDVPVSYAFTGATCNTLYHYRAAAQSNGGLVFGADMTFTTAPCPAAGDGNIYAASAQAIALNSTSRDFLSTVRTEVWYRVRLFARRSYQISAWTANEDGIAGVGALSLTAFSEGTGTVPATPAPTLSGTREGTPYAQPMLGQSMMFQPATTGVYFLRVLGAPAATDTSLSVMVRETTLFSPWTSRAAGFEGFIEMHNNTDAALDVTLSAYDATGAIQGAGLTLSVPADATVFRTATAVGILPNAFAGVVITHNGAFGAISANITTLNGANGLSFDSPFTPREGALKGGPMR